MRFNINLMITISLAAVISVFLATSSSMAAPTGKSKTYTGDAKKKYDSNPRGNKLKTPKSVQAKVAAKQRVIAKKMEEFRNSSGYKTFQASVKKVNDYKWRPVYKLGYTAAKYGSDSRKHLTVVKLPPMGQRDAEDWINETGELGQRLPGLGCKAHPMVPKQAGRPLELVSQEAKNKIFTIAEYQGKEILSKIEDAADKSFKSTNVWTAFNNVRNLTCSAIYAYAQLSYRASRLKELEDNWAECKKEGIYLTQWKVSKSKRKFGNIFVGGPYTRSFSMWGGLSFKCGKINSGTTTPLKSKLDQAIDLTSRVKWSSKGSKEVSIVKTMRESNTAKKGKNCPNMTIPMYSNILKAGFKTETSKKNSENIDIRLGVRASYKGDKHYACTVIYNVESPFNVTSAMTEMKDKAKQNAQAEAKKLIYSILPRQGQFVEALLKVTQ
jgi:hypothetical protein